MTNSELGPVVFSADVRVKLLRHRGLGRAWPGSVWNPFGRVRLLVHAEVIAVRCEGIPRGLGSVLGMNYTLNAADCVMYVADISRRFWLAEPKDEYVVLQTTIRDGLDIAFRPRTARLDDLQREFIRAGVEPAEEPAPAQNPG